MSEKVTRFVSSALLLILFFAGAPVIVAIQDRGPPHEMLEKLEQATESQRGLEEPTQGNSRSGHRCKEAV